MHCSVVLYTKAIAIAKVFFGVRVVTVLCATLEVLVTDHNVNMHFS